MRGPFLVAPSGESRGLAKGLVRFDHLPQPVFVGAIAAVVIGMEPPYQFRVPPAQVRPIGVRLQSKRLHRPLLGRREAASGRMHVLAAFTNMGTRAGADRFQRVGEIRPPRHVVYAGVGPESAACSAPSMKR